MRSSERRKERDHRLPAAHAQGVRWTRAVSPALPSAIFCGLFFTSQQSKAYDSPKNMLYKSESSGLWRTCQIKHAQQNGTLDIIFNKCGKIKLAVPAEHLTDYIEGRQNTSWRHEENNNSNTIRLEENPGVKHIHIKKTISQHETSKLHPQTHRQSGDDQDNIDQRASEKVSNPPI